jgi:hypothetical protein
MISTMQSNIKNIVNLDNRGAGHKHPQNYPAGVFPDALLLFVCACGS